jgi:fused signal recognition particle receptor
MFKFLKEKLKKAAEKFSKHIKESVKEEPEEKPKKEVKKETKVKKEAKPQVKKAPVKKEIKKGIKKEEKKEIKKEVKKELEEKKEVKKEVPKEKKKEGTVFESIKERFKKKEEPKVEKPVEVKKPAEKPEKPEIKVPAKPVEKKPKIEPKVEVKVEKPKIEEKPKPEVKPAPEPEPEPPAPKPEPEPEHIEIKEEKPEEKRGFLGKLKEKITKTTISEDKFNDMFWDLELALLENNVAVEVIEKIKQDLSVKLVNVPIQRKGIDELIRDSLMASISSLFDVEKINMIEKAKQKKPFVIAFVGVNGVGKTTTIAKVAKLFEKNDMKCVMAAADTFRSAAIEQLEEHANKLGVKLIKHDYGSDSAAVAFDAIKHAESTNKDVVLIDTAGRTHVNKNLMDELKKVIRVSKPDFVLFIGDALTGNDAVEQAKEFNDAVGIDGIILAKSDVDEKGGAAISVSYVTKKPILYLGTGQNYEDLSAFSPDVIFENLKFEPAGDAGEEE